MYQVTATLDNFPITQVEIHHEPNVEPIKNSSTNESINCHRNYTNGHNEEISIGSAGSLARRQNMWEDELLSGRILFSFHKANIT